MKTTNVLLGVLGGVAVGAALGILFAPEKGSETRKKILDKSKAYQNDLKNKFDGVVQNASKKYDSFVETAKEYVSDSAKEYVSNKDGSMK